LLTCRVAALSAFVRFRRSRSRACVREAKSACTCWSLTWQRVRGELRARDGSMYRPRKLFLLKLCSKTICVSHLAFQPCLPAARRVWPCRRGERTLARGGGGASRKVRLRLLPRRAPPSTASRPREVSLYYRSFLPGSAFPRSCNFFHSTPQPLASCFCLHGAQCWGALV
jgi:hypothetical protein